MAARHGFPHDILVNAMVTGALAAAALILVSHVSAHAEAYLLHSGDVLEVSVLNLPELKQTSTINPDGQAWLPLVGPVKASGLSLPDLRKKLGELLPNKVFRRHTPDGREYPVVITADEVMVTVAEYRPVYLDGDVAKPGAQPYRPGMTVRQALSLAGGYDVMRFHGRDPFLESADFRSEYYSLWAQFAKEQLHIARLQAELANKASIDRQGLIDTPISAQTASVIDQLESKQFEARKDDLQKEKNHLHRAMSQEDGRIAVLTEQQSKEKEEAQADANDLAEMRENFKKGVVPVMRMSETRRFSLFSATQALQTTALLAQAERQREDLNRAFEKVDDDRHMQLLHELQDAQVNLETLRARLAAVGDKLMYSGMVRSQLVRGSAGSPSIKIAREADGERQTVSADEDTDLMPGDVVEVAVRLEEIAAQSH
jgi:polysaccharide export outer membrane protein